MLLKVTGVVVESWKHVRQQPSVYPLSPVGLKHSLEYWFSKACSGPRSHGASPWPPGCAFHPALWVGWVSHGWELEDEPT